MRGIKGSQWRRARDVVWKRSRGLCWLCKQPLARADMTIDHVVPRSKGGGNEHSNLRAAHKHCNELRGNGEKYQRVYEGTWDAIAEQKRDEP